jgi:hypothetical protein
MIIVRLLSPEPVGWLYHHQLYSGVGADIVMESISLKTCPPLLVGVFKPEIGTAFNMALSNLRLDWAFDLRPHAA